jgi:hypothetical protein
MRRLFSLSRVSHARFCTWSHADPRVVRARRLRCFAQLHALLNPLRPLSRYVFRLALLIRSA